MEPLLRRLKNATCTMRRGSNSNREGHVQTLAEYLVTANVISRFQHPSCWRAGPGRSSTATIEIYERIESGRLATFSAVHIATMHRVCLQFLTGRPRPPRRKRSHSLPNAQRSSRVQARVCHLLHCYHLVDLGAFKFFVLENLYGKRIERILQQQSLIKTGRPHVTRQAALGLAHLHGMQMAHGDVRRKTFGSTPPAP